MAIAASGKPTACLTLTVNTAVADSPSARYVLLHDAWKVLAKRIIRQFAMPAEKRWILYSEDEGQYQEIRAYVFTRKVIAKTIKRLHYMAFIEETEAGEPHLHILLRTAYIPQRWLSQQMQEILQSPIVWIEKIKGVKSAIAYVCKYVTKAPAQFGKGRRYWLSRGYRVTNKEKQEQPVMSRKNSQLVVQQFSELLHEIRRRGLFVLPTAENTLRLFPMKRAFALFGDGVGWKTCPEVMAAYLWRSRHIATTG
jgi:hypothetical protein